MPFLLGFILFWVIFLLPLDNCVAQISRFSQFYYSPTLTNPASISLNGEMSARLNIRNQRIGAGQNYSTALFTFIYPLLDEKKTINRGAASLSLFNESAGTNSLLRTTGILATFAYNLQVENELFLSFGLQGGFFQRSINTAEIRTESQYLDGFDANAPINEKIPVFRSSYALVNAGMLFYKENLRQEVPYYLGIGLYYLNKPDLSFYNQPSTLPITTIFSGEIKVFDNEQFSIHPNFRLIVRNPQTTANIGGLARYYFNNFDEGARRSFVGAGLWYNTAGIAVFGLQLEKPNYTFGISYDISLAGNAPSRQVSNALEISLAWRNIVDRNKNKRAVPLSSGNNNRIEYVEGTQIIIRQPIEIITPQKIFPLSDAEKALFDEDLLFEEEKSDLLPKTQKILDNTLLVLRKYPNILLKITIGTNDQERRGRTYAERRLRVIRNYLILNKISPAKIILQRLKSNQKAKMILLR